MIYYGLTIREQDDIVWGSFDKLEQFGFFKHWITTRKGGVSKGSLAELNLADHVGDDKETVKKNREKVSRILCGSGNIYLPRQVHGTQIIVPTKESKECDGDVLIMTEPGIAGGILTADCLPIIMADPVNKIVALVHAGRLGLFSLILKKTIEEMKSVYKTDPADLVVGIGPGMRSCCYEVGEEIFEGEVDAFKKFWNSDGKLDMIFAANSQLLEAGVLMTNIHDSEICTSCQDNVFFSHRGQKGKAGRFMTGAVIQK
ncbi:MAG: peptidoglycan editing factor PgeF [Nitrospinota bacterium]